MFQSRDPSKYYITRDSPTLALVTPQYFSNLLNFVRVHPMPRLFNMIYLELSL